MAQTPSDAGSGTSSTLPRGKACLRCRKRKMRCDGAKPACSQCVRAHKPDGCQYDDGKGKTRTQALREKIARLEEEIAQLRDPEYSSAPAIVLHDPHAQQASGSASGVSRAARLSSGLPRHSRSLSRDSDGSSPAYSPGGTPSTGSPGLSAAASPYSSFDSMGSPRTPFAPSRTLSPAALILTEDIPHEITYALYDSCSKFPITPHLPPALTFDSRLDIFLQHRHQAGFALHVERLRSSITGSFPGPSVSQQQFSYAVHQTNYQRHPVIANSIYLWASFLSRAGPLGAYEQQFLARTQTSLVDALNITQYQRQPQSQQPSTGLSPSISPSPMSQVAPSIVAIDAIQASVLLSRYFFATGRLHEASYHASAAADLAVQIGLHQINSSLALVMAQQQQQWGGVQGLSAVSTSALRLEPAQDSIELGERIGVFWQVYILDRLLSVALKRSPCIIDDDCVETRIDTPWPEEIEEYEHIPMDTILGESTLRVFFLTQGQSAGALGGFSVQALRVKAAALYSAAARASANWGLRPSIQQGSSSPPSAELQEFQALELTISRFLTTLLPAHQLSAGLPDDDRRGHLAVHTLAHASLVQLHTRFARQGDLQSVEKCVRAAHSAAQLSRLLSENDYEFIDPVFGPCWMTIAGAFALEQVQPTVNWTQQSEARTQQDLNLIVSAMTRLSARYPVMVML